ncbi:MBL fold metallo-hydrolase [Streptomyces flavofungini]|uniref:MBL fold metallo-hydrolase n=1 Tax=Streptomyces flavofungini TaxID=68200 RepID=A0ABS0XB20_9ACTN|nr:MBL fold metallo-hydrolase [Streptomyces flavofungini]MBJ3810412.1 MBL fold metallo-hydrolase [Streptomyces flavofungini]GHC42180.1 MBL fold hydrolase [Streptomyces flavofungini]
MDTRDTSTPSPAPAPAWAEAGWERLAARVGRCRLPVWDCTAGLVVGDDAALMIEAGSSLREGSRLRADARRLLGGDRRVTHLALTHPHFDHVLGAAAFAGVEIFGAVGVDTVLDQGRDELRADAVAQGLDPAAAAEAADLLVHPRHLVCGEWTLDLGGIQVLLANVGPGHSGHDLVVLVPGDADGGPEVVFCGDLVEESGEPQAGPDAAPRHWPAALDRLLDLGGEDALYVPGHGAVVDAAFVRRQRDELARRFGVA